MTKSVIKGLKRSKTHRRKNKLMRRGPYIMKGTCGGDRYWKSSYKEKKASKKTFQNIYPIF